MVDATSNGFKENRFYALVKKDSFMNTMKVKILLKRLNDIFFMLYYDDTVIITTTKT